MALPLLAGCTSSTAPTVDPLAAETSSGTPTDRPQNVGRSPDPKWETARRSVEDAARKGSNGGSEDGTAKAPGAREKSRAIAELEAKLGLQPTERGRAETQPPLTRPPANSPAQLPKEADLKSEADAMVRRFVNHLQGDQIEAARALLIDHAQIETLVSPGIRPVLEGPLLARNNDVLGVLAEVLRGKKLEVKWQPGKLHSTKDRGTFRARVPLLSENILHVDANGIPLQVQIEELVYTASGWRIFTLKTR